MKLKELRKQKGLSQEQVAKELGITLRTYQNYEYEQREPNIEMIFKLSDFYQVTTDYLLGREKSTEQPNPIMQLTNEEMEQRLLNAYFSLPQKLRDDFIKGMAEQLGESCSADLADVAGQKVILMTIRKHLSHASAGCGYDLSDSDEWEIIDVVKDLYAEQADFAVEVDGDSMLPDYKDGDVVYIVLDPEVPVGKVGLFRQNGRGFIKERGKDCLISANPDYPNIYPSDGDIECIGRVIGIAELAK